MKRGEYVINLSKKIVKSLKPFSKKIQVAGSIRRWEKNSKDIDIVLIPKDREKLEDFMRKKGRFIQGGNEKSRWRIEGVKVELYYADNINEWGSMLLAYSGKKGSNIGLRIIARMKGMKLSQHGLFNRKTNRRIAGRTEREIYRALGRRYKEPRER
ncbi:hypothetical protein COU59_01565 [Candidatus Pacearchaeota archaeon CG10_big_fil_rev_8_21_14_0_10_34_12]|nr:MAG: hypothetical protein COU59_01565 [Candidatus Pacearchaeota archaeon CG10_big_fil_rev_8_21_14_0_10_34_12]